MIDNIFNYCIRALNLVSYVFCLVILIVFFFLGCGTKKQIQKSNIQTEVTENTRITNNFHESLIIQDSSEVFILELDTTVWIDIRDVINKSAKIPVKRLQIQKNNIKSEKQVDQSILEESDSKIVVNSNTEDITIKKQSWYPYIAIPLIIIITSILFFFKIKKTFRLPCQDSKY